MDPLSAAIRAKLAPALWERAQAWAAAGAARRVGGPGEHESWRVQIPAGVVYEVDLWPADADHACSCELEVCAHAAAAAIARASGAVVQAKAVYVRYTLRRHREGLAVEREVPAGAVRTEVDQALHRLLGAWWGRPTLPKGVLALALAELAGAHDVRLDDTPIRCDGRPVLPRVLVDDHEPERGPRGFRVRLVRAAGISEAFANGAVVIEESPGAGPRVRPIGDVDLDPVLRQRLIRGEIFAAGEVEKLVTRFLPDLRRLVEVEVRSARLPEAAALPPRLAWEVRADGPRMRVVARIVYGDPPVARVERGELVRLGGPVVVRDLAAERRLEARLGEEASMSPGVPVEREGASAPVWAEGLRGAARDAVFAAAPQLGVDRRPVQPTVRVEPDGDGFRVVVEAGGVRPEALVAAWEAREGLVPLVDGGWRVIPREWLDRHGAVLAELLSARDAEGRVARHAAPLLLDALDALDAEVPPGLAALRALAGNFDAIPATALPAGFAGVLRPYQQRGVDWIHWLSTVGMGGVLADDMGLGKTVQCLVAFATRRAVGAAPGLVVCPTSVLRNWESEAARFVPGLRVCVYHGPGRRLDPEADLVVTSWALLRLDVELLAGRDWGLAVFDEAQAMKNPESQVAQAARRLRAGQRLAVTGTPVENRLEELWSLFHLVNPGLLGGRRAFRDRFAAPIEAGSRAARELLRRRIRPFVLRRLKSEVARDLPPRTDVVLRCTLSEPERELYGAVSALGREDVARMLSGGSYLQVLEVLLRMRQAACHPGLLGKPELPSAKVALLMEELDEILSPEPEALGPSAEPGAEPGADASPEAAPSTPREPHRALIFSQWTSMLDLVEPALRAAGIPFVRLDGSTRDRAAVVAAFNAPDGPPVFLLSLTAGGTGLNLVAADYVFLLDPWWNPAVEDQATDRAHRIGQTKPVVACRIVAEGTVEERIIELQARKRELARAALGGPDDGGDGALAQGLGRDDLLALFE